MIDSPRLSVAGSDRERALLRAGAEEAPTAESVHAAARVLGIVPRAALVAYALLAVFRGVKWSSVVTYVVAPAVAVAGVATVGYVVATGAAARTPLLDAVAVSHGALPVAVRPALVEPPVRADAPTFASPAPVPNVAARTRAVRAEAALARAPGRAEAVRGLQQQIDLIDRARALQAAGDSAGALRALDDFGRRFARSPMAEEAALLRIEATAARGDGAAATALARRFLADHPASIHAAKVRSIVGDGTN